MSCPFCLDETVIELELIDHKKLEKRYRQLTGTDFTYLLDQDLKYCECQNCRLRYYAPLITGDETFYNALQGFEWYYMDEKEEYKEAIKQISPYDKVLEIGSGKGAFAKHLPTDNYTGLDFSQKAKEIAAKNGIKIENEMIQDFADKHPNTFDVVVSFQVLEHVSDPKSFVESQIKALKSGGKLIIAVPSEDSFLKYVTNGILNMPPHHVTRWSDTTLEFIAEQYNLEVIDLYHEKVQKVHKQWYLNTLIQTALLKTKVLDDSLVRKLVARAAELLSKVLVKGLKDELLPNGHTVIAIYKKK